MALTDQARVLIEEVVASFAPDGLTLFDCRIGRIRTSLRLHVTLDRPLAEEGNGVSHEDCTAVTRRIRQAIVEKMGEEVDYHLEVSSPGVERPLRGPEDYLRFQGKRIRLTEEIDGKSRVHRGVILGSDPAEGLQFQGDKGDPRRIPWTAIVAARLTLD